MGISCAYPCALDQWLRGLDLNQRPSGYEPDELPDCSTPRHHGRFCALRRDAKQANPNGDGRYGLWLWHVNGFFNNAPATMPGDVLLFQRLSGSTIGAVRFHGRVRDGIGWGTDAMVTKQ